MATGISFVFEVFIEGRGRYIKVVRRMCAYEFERFSSVIAA